MDTKTCFKCGSEKPLTEFYKHSQMRDGYVNKCKECNKKDVKENRDKNIDYYREYDRSRGYRSHNETLRAYRSKYPNKCKAHRIVQRAIRSGKLFSESCERCGSENTHAHHDDYLKPLNVRWLCPVCHFEWHKQNGEGKNGA